MLSRTLHGRVKLCVLLDDVKLLVQKIRPEFETFFDRNDMRPDKVIAEMGKADVLLNGAGDRAKTE